MLGLQTVLLMPAPLLGELLQYRQLAVVLRKKGPDGKSADVRADFWRKYKELLPGLYTLAQRFHGALPASANVERFFSTGANVITKKRCSLANDTLEDLVMCNENWQVVDTLASW